jgi:hypothetical protein
LLFSDIDTIESLMRSKERGWFKETILFHYDR